MSRYMLDDQKTIDDVNPFVQEDFSLPGTWSDPYEFAPYTQAEEDTPDKEEKSPICATMGAIGDGTIETCNPRDPNCPMSRPLVPERLIDPGMWNYQKREEAPVKSNDMSIYYIVILIIALIAVLYALR